MGDLSSGRGGMLEWRDAAQTATIAAAGRPIST
jgi:hypothetical protein